MAKEQKSDTDPLTAAEYLQLAADMAHKQVAVIAKLQQLHKIAVTIVDSLAQVMATAMNLKSNEQLIVAYSKSAELRQHKAYRNAADADLVIEQISTLPQRARFNGGVFPSYVSSVWREIQDNESYPTLADHLSNKTPTHSF